MSWLAQPALAASAALPGMRDAAQPKIGPLAAAAVGVAVGAGIQIGAQHLRTLWPSDLTDIASRVCVLSIHDIEVNASRTYTDALAAGDESPLHAIVGEQTAPRALPVAAAAFLAGVAAGAAAARPGPPGDNAKTGEKAMVTYNGGLMILLEDIAVKDEAELAALFTRIAPDIARRMTESRQSKAAGARDSATIGGNYGSGGNWSVNGSYTWNF